MNQLWNIYTYIYIYLNNSKFGWFREHINSSRIMKIITWINLNNVYYILILFI